MKIIIISGSHRKNSESERVSHYLKNEFTKIAPEIDAEVFSLAENPIPLWDEDAWSSDPEWKKNWGPHSEKLQSADGFVVVTPEWGGMVPSGLKNLFLLCNKQEFAHKAALITAVSSGIGGAYPVAELRMSSFKNTRICYLPDYLIIRSVNDMLKGETATTPREENLRERITYSLKVLVEYTKALTPLRSSGLFDYKSFPFGM